MPHEFSEVRLQAPSGLKRHPLSALLPNMDEERNPFLEDIEKNGVVEPIILIATDGAPEVLDGWHRYKGAERRSRMCPYRMYMGDDPRGFVLSINIHRRMLTAGQRAKVVVDAFNWREPGGQPADADADAKTTAEMAEIADVSESTIERAKRDTRPVQEPQGPAEEAQGAHAAPEPEQPVSPEPSTHVPEPPAKNPPSDFEAAMDAPRATADVADAPEQRQRSAKDVEIDALRIRVAEAEQATQEKADQLRLLEDAASPEASARLAMLNAKQEELRVVTAQRDEAQQRLAEASKQANFWRTKAQQFEKMLEQAGVNVSGKA